MVGLPDNELIGTLPEQAFDDLVRVAVNICNVPAGAISLLDNHRLWLK